MRKILILASVFMAVAGHADVNPLRISPVVSAVNKVGPAVVNISTEKVVSVREFNPYGDDWIFEFFQPYRWRNVTRQSLGSGILIQPDGVILTNEHIILPASKITVTLSDGSEYEAEILGASRRFDLALIKIQRDTPFPYLPLGSSDDLLIGESVIAIGNPFGLQSTVTQGVISALNREISLKDPDSGQTHTYYDFIQTDASINPGNSGGPLLNILGELIGINTAIFSDANGIGFAIPISKAKRVIDDLLETGEVPRIWMGVYVQDLTPLLARNMGAEGVKGVLVSEVRPDSPGDRSDMEPGDIITAVDGRPVVSMDSYKERMGQYTPGDRIPFTLYRRGRTLNTVIRAEEFSSARMADLIWELAGIKVEKIPADSRYRSFRGQAVIISSVRPGSSAEDIGIRKGDLILQVDRTRTADPEDYTQAIRAAVHRDSVFLVIVRGNVRYRVNLKLN